MQTYALLDGPGTCKTFSATPPAAPAPWGSPVPLALVPTSDSMSYLCMQAGTTGIPVGEHPGAFGTLRKHHVHEGVDLYCHQGTEVFAVERGCVVAVLPFTGPLADMPWWLDTDVVLVEGASGVVAYGEVASRVTVGQTVSAGDVLARIIPVLRQDKGRPMAMLHLELHKAGARVCPEWALGQPHPSTLLDPTIFLLAIARPGI